LKKEKWTLPSPGSFKWRNKFEGGGIKGRPKKKGNFMKKLFLVLAFLTVAGLASQASAGVHVGVGIGVGGPSYYGGYGYPGYYYPPPYYYYNYGPPVYYGAGYYPWYHGYYRGGYYYRGGGGYHGGHHGGYSHH